MTTKDSSTSLFQTYYQLAKPGIVYGNLLSAAAGYLFASAWHIQLLVFLCSMIGIALVIAGACVCNNYLDRNIDAHMNRTKKRALVTGRISTQTALLYASLLSVMGFVLLALGTSWLVVLIGFTAFVDYIAFYGWAKRNTTLSTIIGSFSGAAPILAGYVAARGAIDIGAVLVFLVMVFWQMPHFFGIALYRQSDYAKAGLFVLPVKKGIATTKAQTIAYIVGFVVSCILLTVYSTAGYVFASSMAILGAIWLYKAVSTYRTLESSLWGRKVFLFSLVALLVFSVMLPIGVVIP